MPGLICTKEEKKQKKNKGQEKKKETLTNITTREGKKKY